MKNLTLAINQLEQELDQNRQALYMQYEYTKALITQKIASPPLLMLAFVTGNLIGKKIKRTLKNKPAKGGTAAPREKLSLLQRIMALASEVSLAVNLFNRVKPVLTHLTQKTDSRMTIAR